MAKKSRLQRFIRSILQIVAPDLPARMPSFMKFSYAWSSRDFNKKIIQEEFISIGPGDIFFIEITHKIFHESEFQTELLSKDTFEYTLSQIELENFYTLLRKCRFNEIGNPTAHNTPYSFKYVFYESAMLEISKKEKAPVKIYESYNSSDYELEGKNMEKFMLVTDFIVKLKNKYVCAC